MNTAQTIQGLPSRIGAAVALAFARQEKGHEKKRLVIDALQADFDRIPLDASEEAIHTAAAQAARECYAACSKFVTVLAVKIHIDAICKRRGVPFPLGETDNEILRRAVDSAWWLRQLRTEFARRFEHTAIKLGQVGQGIDAYITRESALRQAAQNLKNKKLLESITLRNEHGQEYTLAELADLGTANKTVRRGELMTRIRGFEEIATKLNHMAMFWTITAPSKFHSVGGRNPKYNGATPRQAQAYLCKIWARMRSALKRLDIQPYGFRIAEPHTDGCPHWHMLFFVDRKHAQAMTKIIYAHALAEDGTEAGAQENRVKLVNIEHGNGGTAAGYIAKYVSKNIDGDNVGDHKAFENGETYTIEKDMFGQVEITPSQRVTYWSQLHGIRQFQQIGGAPVGVWRELRRLTEETASDAPYEIQEAFWAVQKIERGFADKDGKPVPQADWAEYLRAQGGPQAGRGCKIKLAVDLVRVDGRYAVTEAKKPVGVYAVAHAEEIYKSVRYTWEEVAPAVAVAVGVALWGTRTGVNNCTDAGHNAAWVNRETDPKNKFSSPFVEGWMHYREAGREFDPDTHETYAGRFDNEKNAAGNASAVGETVARYQAHRKTRPDDRKIHLAKLQEKYRGH